MVDIYNQFKDFKSFEVHFLNQEKELQKLICTVKSIENNTLVLNANNQKNKDIFAKVGDELQLHIYTDMGIYSASSRVLLFSKGLINSEYVISYPANSKHSQRREYFRADIPVKFRLIAHGNENPEDVFVVESTAKNICGKGMSYISPKPFFDYSSIQIELFFDEDIIRTSAQLVYTKALNLQEHTKFIHAFTFEDISKKDIEFLIKKCFLHQLDLRKKPV